MGQALSCYQCCWSFYCQIHGCSLGLFCFSCWMCGDEHLLAERGYECCKCGGCDHGYGSSCLLGGSYICAPEWMKRYSIRKYIGNYLGPLGGDVQVTHLSEAHHRPHTAQGFSHQAPHQVAVIQQPGYNAYPYQGWSLKLVFWIDVLRLFRWLLESWKDHYFWIHRNNTWDICI